MSVLTTRDNVAIDTRPDEIKAFNKVVDFVKTEERASKNTPQQLSVAFSTSTTLRATATNYGNGYVANTSPTVSLFVGIPDTSILKLVNINQAYLSIGLTFEPEFLTPASSLGDFNFPIYIAFWRFLSSGTTPSGSSIEPLIIYPMGNGTWDDNGAGSGFMTLPNNGVSATFDLADYIETRNTISPSLFYDFSNTTSTNSNDTITRDQYSWLISDSYKQIVAEILVPTDTLTTPQINLINGVQAKIGISVVYNLYGTQKNYTPLNIFN